MNSEQLAHPALEKLASDYEIVREIGRGGIAVVYLARDLATGRDCAIKLIRAKHLGDEEALSRVAREASYAVSLRHPNILPVTAARDLGDEGVALMMDYVPGRTLKRRIREDGALPFAEAVRVLRDIAAALGHAHDRGIIHRDVKPENIFLEDAPAGSDVPAAEPPDDVLTSGARWQRARLADFGIARALQTDTQLTQTGFAIGTPSYMSPECIEGAPIDGRTDLYSLGLVAWEMISGETPWAGESLYAVLYHQKHDQPSPAFADLRPGAPRSLVLAVEGLLEKDPHLRWDDAEDFVAALDGRPMRRRPVTHASSVDANTVRFRRAGATGSVEEETEATGPPPRRRTLRALLMTLAVLAALSAAGYGVQALRPRRGSVHASSPGTLSTTVGPGAPQVANSGPAPRATPPVKGGRRSVGTSSAASPRPSPAAPPGIQKAAVAAADSTRPPHPPELVATWSHFSPRAPLSDSLTMLFRADGTARSRERRLGLGFLGWNSRVTTREGRWQVRSTALGRKSLCVSWSGKRGARAEEACNAFVPPADSLAPLSFAGRYWRRVPKAPQ
ncbi:MAG: serine/threonine-protein kinase [Gemmatimonadaceae bacterium]